MTKSTLLTVVCLGVAVACSAPAAVSPTVPTPLPSTETPKPTTAQTQPAKSGKLRWVFQGAPDIREVPTLMALDALEAQGYAVERLTLLSSSVTVDGMTRGEMDASSMSSLTAWAAIAKGAKIRSIAVKAGITGITLAQNAVRSCADIEGKAVAEPTTTHPYSLMFDEWVKQNCPGTKYTVVLLPDGPLREAALLSGNVAIALVDYENQVDVERQAPGSFHLLFTFDKEFPNISAVTTINVRQEWAAQNPGLAKDLLRNLLVANRRVAADPTLLYAEAQKRFGLDPAAAKEQGDLYLSHRLWDPNGGLTPDSAQKTIDLFTRLGALPPGLKVDDVVDFSYLNAVLDEIGRK